MVFAWKAAGLSYNRYLAVASRVVRQSLKEDKRQAVGRRGQIDLRIQKWTDGKASESKNLTDVIASASGTAGSA